MSKYQNKEILLAVSSLIDLCELLAAGSGGFCHEDGFDVYFAPETFWYHRVKLNGGLSDSLSTVIDQIADDADAGLLPALLCYSEIDYPGETLTALLRNRGYILHTTQMAMYMPISSAVVGRPCKLPEIVGCNELKKWCELTSSNLDKTSEYDGFCRLANNDSCHFLAYKENHEIVGGLLLVCRGRHAGVHEVAVREEYRGQGIASNLLQVAFEIASKQGCEDISLQASEMGEPLYSKFGMKKAGLFYAWIKESCWGTL